MKKYECCNFPWTVNCNNNDLCQTYKRTTEGKLHAYIHRNKYTLSVLTVRYMTSCKLFSISAFSNWDVTLKSINAFLTNGLSAYRSFCHLLTLTALLCVHLILYRLCKKIVFRWKNIENSWIAWSPCLCIQRSDRLELFWICSIFTLIVWQGLNSHADQSCS